MSPEHKQELETEECKYYHSTESSDKESSDEEGEESATGLVAAMAELSYGAPSVAVAVVPSCGTKPKRNTVTLTVTSKTLCSPIQQGLQIAREQGEDTGGF